MSSNRKCLVVSLSVSLILFIMKLYLVEGAAGGNQSSARRPTCTFEIENANRTVSNWALMMRQMIKESNLQKTMVDGVTKEENRIQALIENFVSSHNKKPIERLVEDLATIRRRSNRMALNIYLRTFDMRWPQNSVQLGVAVERVQEACLSNPDRAAMMVLNSPLGATKYSKG